MRVRSESAAAATATAPPLRRRRRRLGILMENIILSYIKTMYININVRLV